MARSPGTQGYTSQPTFQNSILHMSLAGFDTLRREHPDQDSAIQRLEQVMAEILIGDPAATLDERHLSSVTELSTELIEHWLVELMKAAALESRVAWICPVTHGTSTTERLLKDLPRRIECQKCGLHHDYDPAQIDVFFVATEPLLASLQYFRDQR
jgi:hypothetical protein